ncbi:MAG: hypothetical protein ACREXR_24290, partial [Gammaproteobacteria bacterium]
MRRSKAQRSQRKGVTKGLLAEGDRLLAGTGLDTGSGELGLLDEANAVGRIKTNTAVFGFRVLRGKVAQR